jgi:hypothetical protein
MSMQMPVPTDEHRRLHALAGTWVGDETMSPSPWGPGGPAKGRSTCAVACDGFFLTQDYVQEAGGKVTFRGHGTYGYDPQTKRYSWYWVDSMGFVPAQPSYGTWNGSTLTFESQSPHGRGRYTFEFQGKDRYRFKIENSFDGKTWQPMMSGDYRRA